MNCPQFDEALLDAARGEPATPALRAHLAICERCSSSLRQQENLTRGLRALGGGLDIEPAPGLEARLMAAFHEEVGVETRTPWRAMLGAAAAVLLVVASLVVASRDFERSRAQSRMVAAEAEFVPWPGVAALPQFESGQLVRTELPASVLPLLGIEPASGVTSEIVMADVLIGQDGLARAVRLAN
jgi:hypothetical protein